MNCLPTAKENILEKRLSNPNVKCFNRADVVVYGSWVVTLPTHVPEMDKDGNIIYEDKSVHHRDGTITTEKVPKIKEVTYTDEQMRLFFILIYQFLAQRYGKENVISAYVHLDETTPHMHFLFIPIVDDKKWNEKHPDQPPREKVCAKELMNKTEMNVFHRELQKFLDDYSEKDLFPVLNGTTVGGNRTIAELKSESTIEDAIKVSKQVQAAKGAAEQSICEAKEEVKQVQNEIVNIQEARLIAESDMKDWMDDLDKKEIPIVTKLQDGLKDMGVTKDDYDDIKNFADALERPVKGNTGKTYVEILNPEKTLPLLKKIVKVITAVIDKTRQIKKKVSEHAERTKVSIRAKIAKHKEEIESQKAERKPTHKENDISL